ncbi:COX15/CtaA family protein [Thermomonas sp.]|uniref:COX15/CtaA family protein n=1 Tax=Thermomonas sp. TaxID=1971895 RepID=UPI001B74DA1A|nr:COX15/CtaA family protein [Thermomonas sp.]HRB09736.1 COX15/CtaA family protein [Ottowia sp.]MBK6332782.1 COX15/CtaA family protein [Thermomonas sp.]MBK6415261.1 COX15/CtaA family protein [Thermomonas sp.]MBK9669295.1 COX15/CtaA family protein [Thermomonas sp.]MBL0228622.1 COX15/CtaA family protein [Thermomonas sp.]
MNPDNPASRTALHKPAVYRHFHRIAWLAVALAACVIVFGAFVRLSDAGLSCPDWPTCYGKAAWPTHAAQIVDHAATDIRPVEPSKAWREQFHRHIAAGLGLLVFALALLAARRRRFGLAQVVGAAALVAVAIPLYMQGEYVTSSVLVAIAEAVLLWAALRWSNFDLARTAVLTLAVIIFQAMLGMWTVTWLLKPAVVMAHLLGGLTTFSLLAWMAWRATDIPIRVGDAGRLRRLLVVGLVLLGVQIALGGWTSANYAALACGTDYPKCAGEWWPARDFREGFVLWRGIGVDYEGGILDNQARIAIQLAHRMVAILVTGHLLVLALRLLRSPGLRGWGGLLGILLVAQVGLGIANVVMSLPLHVATAHNAGATALLFVLVTLLARVRAPD